MSELYKYLAEQSAAAKAKELEKTRAKEQSIASRPQAANHAAPLMRPNNVTCYAPGYCSKNGAEIVFVCEYVGPSKHPSGREYIARKILLLDRVLNAGPVKGAVYGKQDIKFATPPGLVCPSCGVVVQKLNINGHIFECSAFFCPCGGVGCYGSYRVQGNQLMVTCRKCNVEGCMSSDYYQGTTEVTTQAPQTATAAGSRSKPPAGVSSTGAAAPLNAPPRGRLK